MTGVQTHVGIKLPTWGARVSPEAVGEVAEAADAEGFGSVWVSDHTALPAAVEGDPTASGPPPFPPGTTFLDALTTLAFAAARSSTVQLATGILVAPLRDPVPLAAQVASLDVLSGGRAVLGVGAGWLQGEFALLGRPFTDRGAATDRLLGTLRACWGADPIALPAGPASVRPKPVGGRVPIVVGGHAAPALRRAARHGDAWYASGPDPGEFATARARLRALGGTGVATGAKAPATAPEDLPAAVASYTAAGADFVVVELPVDLTMPGAAGPAVRRAAAALRLGADPPVPLAPISAPTYPGGDP